MATRPPPPAFGDPLPVTASPETVSFLARRRSASALTLSAPGPSPDQLDAILTLAARSPDHGKLAPWRFIVLDGPAKASFVDGLDAIAATRTDAAKAQAKLGKIRVPPLTIAIVSKTVAGEIPAWEQELSAGAVCAILTIAAQAMGYGANWITDWYAYDADAIRLLGLDGSEKVAGFVQIGTPTEAPLERVRPAMDKIVTRWTA